VIPEDIGEPAPVVDLMAALKASLAASGAPAQAAAEAPAAKPARRRTKEQLSIDDAKLRRVEGGGEESAPEASKEDEKPAAPRARKRKAS